MQIRRFTSLFVIFLVWAQSLIAQDFYDIQTIQEIKITFTQSNWDALLDQLKSTDEEAYLVAASVEVNGVVFDSVGVKYKGNSSYSANNQKNPMHIELDHIRDNVDYQGYSDIKLGNGFSDPTFVREALSYEILSNYMVAPRANYAKLWINGVYWGVYSNQESINKKFVKSRLYTDGDNPFFKCNPVGGAGPGSTGSLPTLVYTTADSSSYYNSYEIKSDYGWAQLVEMMRILKNDIANIESVLDVDRVLWMLAFNNVLVNLDSYTGAFAQNYYLYQDENGRFIPVVWDLNMSFGSFPMLGSGAGGALSTTQMQQLDPYAQSANTARPLIQKLLSVPTYKRRYLAHLRTILTDHFDDTTYRERALELQAIIDEAVQADTKKFYTYQNFTNNIDNAITGGGGPGGFGTPGITQLMNGRNTFLSANSALTAVAPLISDVTASPVVPTPGQTIWVTAKMTNTDNATLAYRDAYWKVFTRVTMLDDGNHQDGAGGDGIYGGSFTADAASNQYYVYAENANSGRFLPERAEYEFYQITTNLPAPAAGEVVINELLANNQTGTRDEFNQYEDWVELYNRSDKAFDLAGLQLTDNILNPAKFIFPKGSVILPNAYLMIWLDEDGGQGLNHANFKLSSGGEFLMLSDSIGTVFDSISFGAQVPDISFGRFPNGTGAFKAMPTTFNAQNAESSLTNVPSAGNLRLYPNPANDYLQIEAREPLGFVCIINMLGQTVFYSDIENQNEYRISLEGIASGLYGVKTSRNSVTLFVVE